MTPQPPMQFDIVDSTPVGDLHLTEQQFGDLLARSAGSPDPGSDVDPVAEAHLRTCEQCAAELAGLLESISLFRQATGAYADRQLRLQPRWRIPLHRHLVQPAYFAAAAILLISVVPMQMARRHPPQPKPAVASGASAVVAAYSQATAESDDALLEDVNSEISASVPTPMQALDVPVASTDPTVESVQTSTQRKD
jgi:anti-sigma factor RsiW